LYAMVVEKTKLQVLLHAENLKKSGFAKGAPDTYAVLSVLPDNIKNPNDKPKVIGRTDSVKSSCNPQWTKPLFLHYEKGSKVYVNVGLYNPVKKGKDLSISSAIFEVGEIMNAPSKFKGKKLKAGGIVFIKLQEAKETDSGKIVFQFSGTKLKNVEGAFGGKSDPFFEIITGTTEKVTVYRSKPLKNNLNPEWAEAKIDLEYLCDDLEQTFVVKVSDYERSGKHVPIGEFKTTVRKLIELHRQKKRVSLHDKGKITGSINILVAYLIKNGHNLTMDEYTDTSLMLEQNDNARLNSLSPGRGNSSSQKPGSASPKNAPLVYTEDNQPGHKEYEKDCTYNITIAIDFSGSNGDPRNPNTLHYINKDPSKKNDYEEAITAVASTLAIFDEDETYPVWGFGVKYGGKTQSCFQCGPDSEVTGVDGILKAYRNVMKGPIVMSSPTDITGVINHAASTAKRALSTAIENQRLAYTILLILTDGSVENVNEMMNCLGAASSAPLSIIIIGIGKADFGAMKFLDEFTVQDSRDICQFIEFETYRRNNSAFTRATLEEIPEQIVGFFLSENIPPSPDYEKLFYAAEIDEADHVEGSVDLSISKRKSNKLMILDAKKDAFKIQVPPRVTPGTHFEVESPFTGNILKLVIPYGVPVGGTFVVNG